MASRLPRGFKSKIDEARHERQPEVILWDLTLRYLAGEQNEDWDWETKSFIATPARPGRNQLVFNKLRSFFNAITNLLAVQYPAIAVSPAMPTYDDIKKAIASEQLLRYQWHSNPAGPMQYVYRDHVDWLTACGNAGFHTYWKPGVNRVCTDAVSAYDMLAEAGATNEREASWKACRTVYERSTLLQVDAYKKFKDTIEKAPAATKTNQEGARRIASPRDRLDVWDVYFDDGRHGVLLDDTWLYEDTFNPDAESPLVHTRYNTVKGRYWGQSGFLLVLDLQRKLNYLLNLALDLSDSHSNLLWLVPFGSGVNARNLNTAPDGIIGYQASGGMPTRLPAPAIPSHLFELIKHTEQLMMDILGIHSTTLGKRITGVTSGVAIEKLADQDGAQLNGTQDEIERATHAIAKTTLSMYKRYMTEKMAIKMMDPAVGRVIYQSLESTQIVDSPELEIGTGSLFRADLQDRNNQILQMVQGKMMEPDEARKLLALHLGSKDAMKAMVHYHHAQELLEAARVGAHIEIFPWDPVEQIKEVFEEFMQSPDYYAEAVAIKREWDADPDNLALAEAHDKAIAKADYIRDILVAVSLPLDATKDDLARAAHQKVFPRASPDPEDSIQVVMANASPETQVQAAEESAALAERKALIEQEESNFDSMQGGPGRLP